MSTVGQSDVPGGMSSWYVDALSYADFKGQLESIEEPPEPSGPDITDRSTGLASNIVVPFIDRSFNRHSVFLSRS